MSHLDPDRLSLIALGEAASEDERRHLDVCDECALELAELEYTVVVGRSTVALGDLQAPPDRVWDRIAAELHLGAASGDEGGSADATRVAGDEASVPVADRSDSTRAPSAEKPHRRRGIRLLFALAASLALIVAVVGVWTFVRQPEPVELASATLEAFPAHPGAAGTAVVVEQPDGERQIEVDLDDSEPDDGFREVWLIRADASALVSLGVLEGRTGVFSVPDDIDLREYVLVDISQEPADGDPDHSGDSIVRGELGFA
ncbi:anti-sigma factor [Microbacterium atlanticum]|uniref:anti-sigma factor n=1 Tax=Microbacterium atlanticum TaxID=2782168 RepID=UPI00188905B2|nr:anti-sigma factor [Microbacterium atlanticum]